MMPIIQVSHQIAGKTSCVRHSTEQHVEAGLFTGISNKISGIHGVTVCDGIISCHLKMVSETLDGYHLDKDSCSGQGSPTTVFCSEMVE